jgi:bloom syndrome protein
MTRNNLGDHLSWLLRNVALTKPATTTFPCIEDRSSGESSNSQLSVSSGGSQPRPPLRQAVDAQALPQQHRGSDSALANQAGDVLQGNPGAGLEDGNMGRLTSTSKSKKPSLVSRRGSLPSPASTTVERKQPLLSNALATGTS